MSSDAYVQARAAFVRIDRQIDGLSTMISDIGKHLAESRETFHFLNTAVERLDGAIPVAGVPEANGNDWPTAQKVMQILAVWHCSRREMRASWEALTQDQKTALEPPPPRDRMSPVRADAVDAR